MKKNVVEVFLTTGQTFRIKCADFTIWFDGPNGECSRYKIDGHAPGMGIAIAPQYIAGVRRVK